MVKNTEATEPKVTKPRRPARTLDEQIADLRAKAEKASARKVTKAEKELGVIEEKIVAAEAKIVALYEQRAAARAVLGYADDLAE